MNINILKEKIKVYDDKIANIKQEIKKLDEKMKEGPLMIKLAELQKTYNLIDYQIKQCKRVSTSTSSLTRSLTWSGGVGISKSMYLNELSILENTLRERESSFEKLCKKLELQKARIEKRGI